MLEVIIATSMLRNGAMGLLRRPTTGGIVKTDDWAGPAGRARIRAIQKTSLRLRRYPHISTPAAGSCRELMVKEAETFGG